MCMFFYKRRVLNSDFLFVRVTNTFFLTCIKGNCICLILGLDSAFCFAERSYNIHFLTVLGAHMVPFDRNECSTVKRLTVCTRLFWFQVLQAEQQHHSSLKHLWRDQDHFLSMLHKLRKVTESEVSCTVCSNAFYRW